MEARGSGGEGGASRLRGAGEDDEDEERGAECAEEALLEELACVTVCGGGTLAAP